MRYEFRDEFFGSIAWDFFRKKYLLFDKESTDILKEIQNTKYEKLKEKYSDYISFFKTIEKNDMIKVDKPNYYFIKNKVLNQKPSAPLRIHYAITSKCNLKCSHCFTRNILNRKDEELSYKEKINLLDQMVDLGIREMLVSGGEPFLAQNFTDFLEEAIKRKISIKVFSNGLLLNEELINKIKDIKIDYLAISIDGTKKETISKVRGNFDFEKLKNNIKNLTSKCSFPIVMQITVTRANYEELDDYLILAEELGIKRIKIRALKPGGSILKNKELMISAEEYLDFCKRAEEEKIEKNLNARGIDLDCTIGNIRLSYNEKEKRLEMENLPQPYSGFGCVGGKITLFIDSFGFCHPCAFIDNFLDQNKATNLKEKRLVDIWQEDGNIKKMCNLTGNKSCFECEIYNICRGGCRARAIFESKDHDLNLKDGWCPKELGLKIKNDNSS